MVYARVMVAAGILAVLVGGAGMVGYREALQPHHPVIHAHFGTDARHERSVSWT